MSNLIIQKAITVNTDAYTASDCIGGKQTVATARLEKPSDRVLNTVIVADKAQQKAAMNIIFFKADPATSTLTNNAAIDISDADLLEIIGVVEVTADDYIDFADNSVACVGAIGIPIDSDTGSFYFTIQAVGTPTYVAVADLHVTLGML